MHKFLLPIYVLGILLALEPFFVLFGLTPAI